MTEGKMVGWHHWLNGHEFEQALGDGEGWRSFVCYSLWGRKESDMTEQLNWTARRSNQSILKEINREYSSEGVMLKLKLSALAT